MDSSGAVSFAGASYKRWQELRSRRSVQVGVVDGQVVITLGGETIGTHAIRHDRSKEHGALANPYGRPRKSPAAA